MAVALCAAAGLGWRSRALLICFAVGFLSLLYSPLATAGLTYLQRSLELAFRNTLRPCP